MAIVLRPPVQGDHHEVVPLSRLFYPERAEDPAVWQKATETAPTLGRYYVAVDAQIDQVIGYGCLRPDLPRQPESGIFRLHVGIAPERRQQGIGSQLFSRLLQDLQDLDASKVRTRVRATEIEALKFLERRGFTEYERMLFLAQDLAALPTMPSIESGVEITTLKAELERAPECLPAIHALQNACFADIPSGDPFVPPSFEDFTRSLRDPLLLEDCFFLAKYGGEYIGISYAASDPKNTEVMGHRFTGVLPAHRRKSIAKALKIMVTQYAREHGYKRITTATLQVNRGMRAVNESLGFTTQYPEARLQRSLLRR